MRDLLEGVGRGRSCRSESGLKVRQPLSRMIVSGATLPQDFCALAEDELNVKAVEFVNDASSFISYRVKPQLKTLGPRYGKLLPKINAYLAQDGIGDKVVAAHKAGNSYDFELEGAAVSLAEADVLIIGGTSLNVYPAAGFINYYHGNKLVLINKSETPYDHEANLLIHDSIGKVLKACVADL